MCTYIYPALRYNVATSLEQLKILNVCDLALICGSTKRRLAVDGQTVGNRRQR